MVCRKGMKSSFVFLSVALSPLFPSSLILGMEIRVKVSDFVIDRIQNLRKNEPGCFTNVACIRTNAMKYLPNYFNKGQVNAIFCIFMLRSMSSIHWDWVAFLFFDSPDSWRKCFFSSPIHISRGQSINGESSALNYWLNTLMSWLLVWVSLKLCSWQCILDSCLSSGCTFHASLNMFPTNISFRVWSKSTYLLQYLPKFLWRMKIVLLPCWSVKKLFFLYS